MIDENLDSIKIGDNVKNQHKVRFDNSKIE